jgi:type I restriction enzyme S subunit
MSVEGKSLDYFGKVGRGKSRHRPRNDPALYGGPYPFIQTADITNSDLYVTSYSQTYTEAGLAQSKLWEPGVLCIVNAGVNTGDSSILGIQACFPDSVISFSANPRRCDVRFIKYFLDSIKSGIRSITMGATQDNLSVSKLLTIKVPAYPVETQRKIAGILSAYDDLIENNRRRIAILERMAEELYREWFVRMRFPGYQNTKFVKGVPEGWVESTLGELSTAVMGQSPSSEFYNTANEGLPFNQGVGTYGFRFPRRETWCSVDGRRAKPGDILFSVRAPVGRLNIADCEMIIGRGLAAIRHRSGLNHYLFYLLRVSFCREDIIGNGSIFNSVGKSELAGFKLFKPSSELQSRFNDFAKPIDEQIEALVSQNDRLVATRDSILSRLISGRVDCQKLNVKMPISKTFDLNLDSPSNPELAHA